jgi:uncharacterized protein YbdZ (MbtH family)
MAQQIRTGKPRATKRIQYVVWTGEFADIPAAWRATGHFRMDENGQLVINTMHGPIRPEIGEHLTKGTVREFYAMPAAVYHAGYEDVE